MTELVIDRKAYALFVGEPEELLDPIPSIACGDSAGLLAHWRTMQPHGPGVFSASLSIIADGFLERILIRYGEFEPITYPIKEAPFMLQGCVLNCRLITS